MSCNVLLRNTYTIYGIQKRDLQLTYNIKAPPLLQISPIFAVYSTSNIKLTTTDDVGTTPTNAHTKLWFQNHIPTCILYSFCA